MISFLALLLVVGSCVLACQLYARVRGLPRPGLRSRDDLDAELAELLDGDPDEER